MDRQYRADFAHLIKGKTMAVTGPRPDKLWNDYALIDQRTYAIEDQMIEDFKFIDPSHVIIGMAQGIDMLAGYVCYKLDIPFTAAIPGKGQTDKWSQEGKAMWKYLTDKAADVYYVSDSQCNIFSFHNRNHWMVDNSSGLYGVWDGKSEGGTKKCLEYARKAEKPTYIQLYEQ